MIASGTGHRPNKLGGYSKQAQDVLVSLAIEALLIWEPDEVLSGMALGWDTALAIAAVILGIPLTAAVPFEGQESKWQPEQQELFHYLLSRAARVVYTSEPGYAPWKMQVRNVWMVDNSDVVLALWNGSDGGTANCLKYAEKKQALTINLWNKFQAKIKPAS